MSVKLSPRAQSWLVLSVVAFSLLAVIYYIVPYLFNVTPMVTYEHFNNDPVTEPENVKEVRESVQQLPENDKVWVCTAPVDGTMESDLEALTREIERQATEGPVRDYAEYQSKTGGPNAIPGEEGNPIANKPIEVTIDIGTMMAKDTFAEMGNERNPESDATSVRALLDKYTAKQLGSAPPTSVSANEMAINKAYLAMMGEGAPVVGCPVIDPSKYYTERQLAQCAGCTPDDLLRSTQ